MATELARHRPKAVTLDTDNAILYVLGGTALILLGTGLILSNPSVRKYLGQIDVRRLARQLAPDIDRYLKMRAM